MQRYHHDIDFILEKLTYSIVLNKTLFPGKSLAHFIRACQGVTISCVNSAAIIRRYEHSPYGAIKNVDN